jgi:hypothetical protein
MYQDGGDGGMVRPTRITPDGLRPECPRADGRPIAAVGPTPRAASIAQLPDNGETLTQVIYYSITDGNGLADSAELRMTIHRVTDPD